MRTTLLFGMLALLSACSKDPAPPQAHGGTTAPSASSAPSAPGETPAGAASNALSAEGIGSIRFGMTLEQAQQAAGGGKATLPEPFDPACSMVRFPSLPKLRFMVENDVVTRADAEPGVENAVGVAFGATLADIRASHPEAQITPHKYDENGHYVTFPSADGRSAIILEETGGKVTKMRAGLQPAVAYVETCG